MPALVRGIILLWSGLIAKIPNGFVICDGTNGTPNLTDMFVRGAGHLSAPGETGGNVNHNHTFTGDGHFHDLALALGLQFGPDISDRTTLDPAAGTTDNANGLPPYYALAYIMKT